MKRLLLIQILMICAVIAFLLQYYLYIGSKFNIIENRDKGEYAYEKYLGIL